MREFFTERMIRHCKGLPLEGEVMESLGMTGHGGVGSQTALNHLCSFFQPTDSVILALQSTAGAARARDVLPVANPSPATSRQSPCTSSPAGTSCAGPAWPSARRLRRPPSTAGAARGWQPLRMSGGFTSDPQGCQEEDKELLLCPTSAQIRPRSRRESRRVERTRSCAYRAGGWGVREQCQSLRMTKAIASLSRNMYLSRTGLQHCPGAQRFSTGAFRTSSASPASSRHV